MSTGESESRQDPEPRKLGLDRLSPGAIDLLEFFISESVPRLVDRFEVELRETLLARDPERGKAKIEETGRSAKPDERRLACQVIPNYAVADPDHGFALWRQLVKDVDEAVHDDARQALVNTLGVLDLDPEGVVSVIQADNEWFSGQTVSPAS